MKFRVETWDTATKGAGYVVMYEGPDLYASEQVYLAMIHHCPPTTLIRRSDCSSWYYPWRELEKRYGTRRETKPMSAGGWIKHDCGCADYRCQWHTTQGWAKKEKPMSTKQRGDVEKVVEPGKFRIHSHGGNYMTFDRDEFRRIWEAGNAEFNLPEGQLGTLFIENRALRTEVREKAAEIARERTRKETAMRIMDETLAAKDREIERLKAQAGLHHVGPCSQYAEEIARLRGWLEKMRDADWHSAPSIRCDKAMSAASRALAGEKVPE